MAEQSSAIFNRNHKRKGALMVNISFKVATKRSSNGETLVADISIDERLEVVVIYEGVNYQIGGDIKQHSTRPLLKGLQAHVVLTDIPNGITLRVGVTYLIVFDPCENQISFLNP